MFGGGGGGGGGEKGGGGGDVRLCWRMKEAVALVMSMTGTI